MVMWCINKSTGLGVGDMLAAWRNKNRKGKRKSPDEQIYESRQVYVCAAHKEMMRHLRRTCSKHRKEGGLSFETVRVSKAEQKGLLANYRSCPPFT